MFGNQWSGGNDPVVVEGLKEVLDQLPEIKVNTEIPKKLWNGLAKSVLALRHQVSDETEESALPATGKVMPG